MSDLNKFVQAPKLYLSGSGISSTATSIQVEQLVKPGTTTNITMTDFGDTGYGVLEPGTDREENFSFTGISFDSDNRATFTGVTRGLDFVSPYTENAALKHQHAGGTVAYISNTAPFYNELSGKDNDETVTGTWTFTSTATPRYNSHPTFTADEELIDKKYADDLAIAGAPDGAEAVKGLYEAATSAEVAAGDDTGTTTAPTVVRPSKLAEVIQKGSYLYAADAGANDTYVITLVPALAAYVAGQSINFTPNTSNTGACTINVNGLGAKNIKKYCNGAISDLETNDLKNTMPCHLIYDGTQFILQTTPATSMTSAAAYEAQTFFDAVNGTSLQSNASCFGGTGADGALNTSGGTVNIDCANSNLVIKNYTTINVATNNLTFTNPATDGTIIVLRSQGNVTISSTIDASGMGAAGGAHDQDGTTAIGILDDNAHCGIYGAGGGAAPAGGAAYSNKFLYSNTRHKLLHSNGIFIAPGSGGGGGRNDEGGFFAHGGSGAGAYGGAGGAGDGSAAAGTSAGGGGNSDNDAAGGTAGTGGRGGGAILIECGGDLNFTGTINVSGNNGGNSSDAGAGGGGAGGMGVVLYRTATSTAGTINDAGGNGGTSPSGAGGAGGASSGGLKAQIVEHTIG